MEKEITTIEKRETKISSQETVEIIIDICKWQKYHNPRDENERGHNRWIDRVIEAIENYIETD